MSRSRPMEDENDLKTLFQAHKEIYVMCCFYSELPSIRCSRTLHKKLKYCIQATGIYQVLPDRFISYQYQRVNIYANYSYPELAERIGI